jgi:phosphopantothenoylcysteine decarboxylase/phosphopantothenate--cysteine ligase
VVVSAEDPAGGTASQDAASLDPLAGREIILGVSGGVAAYKAAAVASLLVKRSAGVTAVLTKAARRFVGEPTFAALTSRPVATRVFDPERYPLGAHIELVTKADLLLVAPASADLLAKAACGLADDLVSTLMLSAECPVIVAPAMNAAMWEKPAVQRNVHQLLEDGVGVIGPERGWLACRRNGAGRMAEPETIAEVLAGVLAGGPLPQPAAD